MHLPKPKLYCIVWNEPTPSHGQAKAGWPARTYIQQLCEDTGCSPEDLPEAINDREEWREMVRDIRAGGTRWWWWYILELQRITVIFFSIRKHLYLSYFYAHSSLFLFFFIVYILSTNICLNKKNETVNQKIIHFTVTSSTRFSSILLVVQFVHNNPGTAWICRKW